MPATIDEFKGSLQRCADSAHVDLTRSERIEVLTYIEGKRRRVASENPMNGKQQFHTLWILDLLEEAHRKLSARDVAELEHWFYLVFSGA